MRWTTSRGGSASPVWTSWGCPHWKGERALCSLLLASYPSAVETDVRVQNRGSCHRRLAIHSSAEQQTKVCIISLSFLSTNERALCTGMSRLEGCARTPCSHPRVSTPWCLLFGVAPEPMQGVHQPTGHYLLSTGSRPWYLRSAPF